MELRIISDLHRESGPFEFEKTDADKSRVLIVAGDLAIPELQTEALMQICGGFRNVLYVPGNHEYEGEDIATYDIGDRFREIRNLSVLDGEVKVIDDVAFFGTTLWTDFQRGDWFCMHNAKDRVSDYTFITNKGRKFSPQDALEIHNEELGRLRKVVENLREMKRDGTLSSFVIITHHAPSKRSMDPNFYIPLTLEGIFYSDLDLDLEFCEADLWIHGHVHSSSDYFLGDTRVLCNPRGNHNWANPNFNPNFVVEINSKE